MSKKPITLRPRRVALTVKMLGLHITGKKMNIEKLSIGTIVLITIGAIVGRSGRILENTELGHIDWTVSDPSLGAVVIGKAGEVFFVPSNDGGVEVVITGKGDANPETPEGFMGKVTIGYAADEADIVELSTMPVTNELFMSATV